MKHGRKFEKHGLLAMRADLWGSFFEVDDPGDAFELRGDAAIVSISGPLTHHPEWFWDSYDAIAARIDAALSSPAKTLVLRIDSPGGDVAGCFETVRSIRARAAAAGKRIVAYADGMAASAGYALACAADFIAIPPTGFVGSIGCISTLVDVVEFERKMGVNVAVIASGERKRYGHPNVPISDAAIANTQRQVDTLADLFFELVAEARPAPVATISGFEAGMFIGTEAVAAKLADRVCTFDELLESLSSAKTTAPSGGAAKETEAMSWKEQMKKAAEEGDEDAKKCLDAMGDGDDAPPSSKPKPKGEGDDAPPKKDDDDDKSKDEPKGEGDDAPPKKDDEKAAARAPLESRVSAIEERFERERLIASRTDMPRELSKKLATAPLAAVRWTVENLPKVAPAKAAAATTPPPAPKTSPLAHAGATVPSTTRAAEEGDDGVSRRSEHADELDVRMGLAEPKTAIRHEGTRLILGVMTPAQARAELARREKETAK